MDRTALHLQYITDESGKRTAVILPLQEFEELLAGLPSPPPVKAPQLVKIPKKEEITVSRVVTPVGETTEEIVVYDLEQKILFVSQHHETINRMLASLRYYEDATAKLDRKLQIQRLISDLESELHTIDQQLKPLRKNANLNTVRQIREANKTVFLDSTEYSLEQKLIFLEQNQLLFTKLLEELRQQETLTTGVERQPQTKKLINSLENELQDTRWRLGQLKKNAVFAALYNVPQLPRGFVVEEDFFTKVKNQLFADAVGHQKVPVLIQADSGAGKSVLAVMLAQDTKVRKTFPDGIFWTSLGKEPNLLAHQTSLIQALENSNVYFPDLETASKHLHRLCETRALLLILDDVWDVQDILPFNIEGEHNQMLVTTSEKNLLSILKYFIPETQSFPLAPFSEDSAKKFFTQQVAQHKLSGSPVKIEEWVRVCDYLPATLKLVANAANLQPVSTWPLLIKDLQNDDYQLPERHLRSLMQALRVNVELLGEQGEYYLALAVFGDHLNIHESTVVMLWRYLYQLLDEQAYSFISELARRGLLSVTGKIPHRLLSLQTFQYDYLSAEAELDKLHPHLLAAYRRQCGQHGWLSGPDDGYFFEYLSFHLIQANRRNELRQLLVDYDWMYRKLLATSIHDLANDYELLDDKSLNVLKQTLYDSAIVLANDKHEFANQLLDRLWETVAAKSNKDIQALLNQAKEASPNWRWQPHFTK